ncbi:MAG: NAD(P)/FAD-dependent oxidoreductase [Rhodospirillaceae bacterium]|nr:NAD(P)/FAD-dependent oxidoreductase [Rhodospirillaceae bacterium]
MTGSRPPVDLAVVGGGFAGLACARSAAMLGLSVVVIDAKPEPGAKVRTTGILVREVIEDLDLPARLMRRVRGVRLYGDGPEPLELWAPGYYFAATDTAGLVRWLAGEARRAGAELWQSSRLVGLTETGAGVDLEMVSQGERVGLSARLVVGADGARSTVARLAGLGRNRHWLTGLELEYPVAAAGDGGDAIDRRFLHCLLSAEHARGYIGWVVPGVGVTQVGVAAAQPARPHLAGFLGHLAGRLGLDPEELAPERAIERRAGRIPAGGRVGPIGTPRVVLAGDAAGLVSPLTGGGIRLALASGRQAALAAADHLIEGGPSPAAQLARTYPRLAGGRLWLRRLIERPLVVRTLARSLDTPLVRAAARRIFFHRSRIWPLSDGATAQPPGAVPERTGEQPAPR